MTRVLSLLLLAMAAPALARDHADPLAGYTPGPAQDCIEMSRVQGPDITDDHTILYRENRRRIWRADLPGQCPGLRRGVTLIVFDQSGTQLCRNDRFRTIDALSRIPGPVCRFGSFTPFERGPG